jgi:hypothetical protein
MFTGPVPEANMAIERNGRKGGFVTARVRSAAKSIVPFWIAALLTGSFLPGSTKLFIGTKPYEHNHPIELQHRLVHFGAFGMTTLLFLLKAETRRHDLMLTGAAFLLGFLIEAGQFAIGLSAVLEWWDIRDDFFAAVTVLIAFHATCTMHRTIHR